MNDNERIRHRRRTRQSQGRYSYVTHLENTLMLLAWQAGALDEAETARALDVTMDEMRALCEQKVADGVAIGHALTETHDKRLAKIKRLRDKLAELEAEAGIHDSDCAVHNEPAYPAGECNCRLAEDDDE